MSTHDGYSTPIARYLTVNCVAEELPTLIGSTANPSYPISNGVGIHVVDAEDTITFRIPPLIPSPNVIGNLIWVLSVVEHN